MFKKLIISIIILLISQFVFAAGAAEKIQEYTLENGMSVFLLEDSQDARVHIEYSVRAGFSSQTQNNCGFFKLFTRMVKAANPSLDFTDIQCNADSSRYFIDITPSQMQETLTTLSDSLFSPDFSDEILIPQLNELKKEVSKSASDMGTYINAAIDSRVFSAAPWKHDSGIYPPLFKKTTDKKARTALKEIADLWYTPKNSAIFICGNINIERTLLMLKNSFGRFYSNSKPPLEKTSAPVNHQRKYVFHSPDISSDLTQLVVQYTMLDMEQTDLMALALGYEGSLFKQLILGYSELNIPGDEYINVSAAHKKDTSRLIIQTLLQPPEGKKAAAATNSFKQSQLFLAQLNQIKNVVQPEEFEYAKNQSEYSLNQTQALPQKLMERLSAFWALQPYMNLAENDAQNYESKTAALFMSRKQSLREKTLSECLSVMDAENPFIFVIINSKDYKANKKSYDKAGFEEINEKNASWYVQTMFKEMKEAQDPAVNKNFYIIEKSSDDNNYYQRNLEAISSFTLSNEIRVVTKKNPLSSKVSLVLSINGGKYNSADDNGFEDVMINLLANLIQKNLLKAQEEGIIIGSPYVSSHTDLASSQIIIEIDSEDTRAAIRKIAESIVYGEIAPADADRAVSARKYKKRLENGTASNQMYSKLINHVYGKGSKSEIFETEKEILAETDYTKILSAYPALLNAGRYNLIFCGDLPANEELKALLEETFGLLAKAEDSQSENTEKNQKESSKKTVNYNSKRDITVKVRHTFLTDIPAEKAGPQPAVLIPTTEFLDPVIYGFSAPETGTQKAALYNALLSYLASEVSLAHKTEVSTQFPGNDLELGCITVMNVAHTRELDAIFKSTVQSLTKNLSQMTSQQAILSEIKNNWLKKQMEQTSSDTGTALLIQKGFELAPDSEKESWYLTEYKIVMEASAQDYLEVMEYFPIRPPLRVYSSDSKK